MAFMACRTSSAFSFRFGTFKTCPGTKTPPFLFFIFFSLLSTCSKTQPIWHPAAASLGLVSGDHKGGALHCVRGLWADRRTAPPLLAWLAGYSDLWHLDGTVVPFTVYPVSGGVFHSLTSPLSRLTSHVPCHSQVSSLDLLREWGTKNNLLYRSG